MKTIYIIMTVLAGVLFLAYDLWLIWSGNFQPGTILPLVAWLGVLLWYCGRRTRLSKRLPTSQ